jgi:hypothetical protein
MPDTERTAQPKGLWVWGGLALAGLCVGAALLAAAGWLLFRFREYPSPGPALLRTATPTERRGQMPSPPTAPPTDVAGTSPVTASPRLPTETPAPPTATWPPAATSVPSAVTLSPTPTLSPATATSSPTATAVSPIATSSPTATSVPPTETLTPTPTSTPVTADPKPATATPTPTVEAPLAQVSGRVVRDGASVGAGTVVQLREIDDAGTTTATTTTTTDADRRYAFDSTSLEGTFNVEFAQAWNEQYEVGEVASWAWLEGEAPSDGAGIELPDLEISLEVNAEMFEQVAPAAGASFSTGQITPRTPLTFEWTPYSGASLYWVDLYRKGETDPVWQSLLPLTYSSFNGTLNDKTSITAGTYWWSVGAQKQIGAFELFVYGWPRALIIEP